MNKNVSVHEIIHEINDHNHIVRRVQQPFKFPNEVPKGNIAGIFSDAHAG